MATIEEFRNFMPSGALTCDRCANPTDHTITMSVSDSAFSIVGGKLRLCERCREEFRDWWMAAKPRRLRWSDG